MVKLSLLITLAAVALMHQATPSALAQETHPPHGGAMQQDSSAAIHIPPVMVAEHEALHSELTAISAGGGKTGQAARKVEEALAPHFEEENRFALPPLGVLPALARGEATEEMRPVIGMAQHVEQNLDRFIEEHGDIMRALDELESAARMESRPDALRFVTEFRAHAEMEEEVLYPTTILIGRYLEQALAE